MGAPAISAPARTSPPAQRRKRSAARPAPARRVHTPSKATRSRTTARPRPASRAKATTGARRRSRITPAGGVAMIPVHAVGGAAGAVGGIADSSLLVGMTRGRAWIGVLGLLLGGIVALNVIGLSLSASTSGIAAKIDQLERANTVTQAKIAKRSSSDRVQALAAGLGLDTPSPRGVRYLKAKPGDAAAAAKRLQAGEVSVLDGLPIAPAFAEAAADPATGEAVIADAEVETTDPTVAPVEDATQAPATDAAPPADAGTTPTQTTDPATGAAPPGGGGVTP